MGGASVRLNIIFDARRATAGSTGGVSFGLRPTRASCRTPHRIKLTSATDHQCAPAAHSNLAGAMSSSHRADAWRRYADDPATLLHLIACRMGQGAARHRGGIARVEPAFKEVK